MLGSGLPLGKPQETPACNPALKFHLSSLVGRRKRQGPKNLEPPVLRGTESPRCKFESRVSVGTWTPALCPTGDYQKL